MPNEELSNKDTTPHDGSNEDKIKEPHDNVGTNSSDHTENESKPNAVSSKINEAPSSLDSEVRLIAYISNSNEGSEEK